VPPAFSKWTDDFKRLLLDELSQSSFDQLSEGYQDSAFKYLKQTIAMFLFSTLDFVDTKRKV
jgi:hypothetical protein